jgi:hypothetical protein
MRLWHSFQGCFIAVGHYVLSILLGIATYYNMKSLDFPPFVAWTSAIAIGMTAFQVIYILKHLGDKP